MAITSSDVLGWWDCQEGTGSSVNDETSNNRDATVGASVSWTTGGPTNLPNGLSFPGGAAASKAVVAFDYDYSEATMAVWVNVTSAPSETNWVIGLGNGGGEGDILVENNTGYKFVGIANNGADRKIIGSAVSTNTLYHVVYVIKSGAFELFVNGSSVGTNTGTGTLADAGNNFVFGQRSTESGTRYLVGKIHQVCLFNRALTSSEVTSLYNGGSGRNYSQAFTTNYSLVCAQGSYSLTGYAAAISKGYNLLMAQGAYVLSGFDAAFKVALTVTMAHGSYAVSGFSASLVKGYNIALGYGSYVLTGFSARFPMFWRTLTKNVATFSNMVKNVATWVSQSKTNV